MKRTKFKAIKCELCGKEYLRITNTHLWKEHQITMEEYKEQFPDAPIDASGLAKSRVTHLRDKTYEEIYGEKIAKKLKKERSIATTKQMKNPEQRQSREKIPETFVRTKQPLEDLAPWTTYRQRALKYYGLECQRCGLTTQNPSDFVVHHKDLNNVPSVLGNHTLENLMVLCPVCHSKIHNELSEQTNRWAGISSIEKGTHYILKGLQDEFNLDLTDENFTDTPKRVARAYAEIFSGIRDTKKQIKTILDSAFPCEFNQMIIVKNIEVFGMCPHHLLPVQYKISAAYIPAKGGQVVGISKLSRIVELLAKRPVLQEQLVLDVTKALMSLEKCEGAACMADGVHFCMAMRGVKQPHAHTITSNLEGSFLTDSIVRAEFMSLIKQ